jgi:hypothetical protein
MSGIPIKVDVTPEQLNAMIADAVLNSKLGEAIKEAVKREADRISDYSWKNRIIDNAIDNEIKRCVARVVESQCAAQIQILICERLTPQRLSEMVDEHIKKLTIRREEG